MPTHTINGLFPDDAALLPKGWTPQDAANIKSYFDQYRLQPTEDDKIAFARQTKGSALPGRKKWRDWISAVWRTSRIHERIISVLHTNNCHPLTLSAESANGTTTWPMGGTWIPLCLDAVASDLFGEDCLDQHGRLPESLRAPTQALVQRTWMNLTKRLDRGKKRLSILEQGAIQAFDDLDDALVTKPQLRKKIAEMQAELDRLMTGLGANIKKKDAKISAPRLFKLSKEMLETLSTEEEVQDIISLYHERFDTPANAPDDVPLIDCDPIIQNPFGPPVEGADPGVEVEAKMSPAELSKNLGFVKGLPLLFNNIRHRDGLTMWTNPEAFLAGVHAIMRGCLTVEPNSDHCTGMLVADEVGLGKTYLAATAMAFLSEAAIQQDNLKIAPILIISGRVAPLGVVVVPMPGTLSASGTLTCFFLRMPRFLLAGY
ncbi:hypothetical protein HYPSUDRAFT_208778 [Hypholoma sublateritium FD-334 SS-4]|uniref:Uncharacterized protein n=1 Tax=Hypholoma sublateritium (strain FD-334 SS-4) TaxID=945553 RepID=A0A0D2NCP1_HYPSF|nr:hypothetical protein HYPSUDRAFT_208778 [Hypholoma sublateritium FD-334 SS-4]